VSWEILCFIFLIFEALTLVFFSSLPHRHPANAGGYVGYLGDRRKYSGGLVKQDGNYLIA
jgi:hypothetical protein